MSKRKLLCILFALIMIAMIALAVAGRSRFPVVNKAVAAIVLPVENAINYLGRVGDVAGDGMRSLRSYWRALTVLQSENEQLKKDNDELRYANLATAAIYAENHQLRELLAYKETHEDQITVAARVIARNFGDLHESLYINAGENKGLRREMAVISNGALAGVIDEVYGGYAKVLLITSPRCRIGGRVLRASSRAVGITTGNGSIDGMLLMEHIFREASIMKDDIIVTSGFGGNHPDNILIGKVISARLDSVGLLQEAVIAPSANIDNIEQVLIVTGFTPVEKIDINDCGGQAK
ncbi:MAG: rod shape-determining protein MreC [Phascolarctobacterium sp.]|nr:rod shape-determining protein MreC [Phascolarctobacterium sp.]